ncbi:hypothetical protein [Mesorhizobium sp. B2-1-3A]|uniref:hypothetical protein n=1 Tax=Mesorhizobium sp. B2-1-3A TaxID=2589971 RepID=UPI00112CD51E|nr:hypothetical protein [Mesorhizobium sp. B2-1-3A]TPN01699.1 hypothetical protein FJ977_04190 [Mesorhizobium sp. B2-1-3A]
MGFVSNVFAIAYPALLLGIYMIAVGLAIEIALSGQLKLPRSLGIAMAIGAGATVIPMAFAYRLTGDAMLPVLPLGVAALIIFLIYLINSGRILLRNRTAPWQRIAAGFSRLAAPSDFIAAIAAVLIILPVIGFGLTSWTSGTNDFPSYAGSAQVWMSEAGASDFMTRHTDAFGAGLANRANSEKPMVTALLVLASEISGVPPYQLLTPIMLVLLFMLFSALLILCSKLFMISNFSATLAVIIPTFSIVPISRVYDAQIGQVAAVALLACFITVIGTGSSRKTWGGSAAFAVVAGLIGAAALGSNFTLAIGSGLMLSALAIWLLLQRPGNFRRHLLAAGMCAALILILSGPMLDWYYFSYHLQSTGEAGFDIPFASPLAAIGQQVFLVSSGLKQALLSWCIVFVTVAAINWAVFPYYGRERITNIFILVAVAINASIIGLKFGWNNYAMHKWLGVFIALCMPPILAYIISRLRGRWRIAAISIAVPLAVSSIAIGTQRGSSVTSVIPQDLLDLQDDARISALDAINIKLGNIHENSIAALVLNSGVVTVTEQTYASGTSPTNGPFLVHAEQTSSKQYSNVIKLNDTYALASIDDTPDEGGIDFSTDNPDARRFLSGKWYESESWGTWSGDKDNYVSLDLPPNLHNTDVAMTLIGRAFANDKAAQTIRILVNGVLLSTKNYTNTEMDSLKIVLPRDLIQSGEGRLTVDIQTDNPLSPSAFGSPDKRLLAFGLARLEIEAGDKNGTAP